MADQGRGRLTRKPTYRRRTRPSASEPPENCTDFNSLRIGERPTGIPSRPFRRSDQEGIFSKSGAPPLSGRNAATSSEERLAVAGQTVEEYAACMGEVGGPLESNWQNQGRPVAG